MTFKRTRRFHLKPVIHPFFIYAPDCSLNEKYHFCQCSFAHFQPKQNVPCSQTKYRISPFHHIYSALTIPKTNSVNLKQTEKILKATFEDPSPLVLLNQGRNALPEQSKVSALASTNLTICFPTYIVDSDELRCTQHKTRHEYCLLTPGLSLTPCETTLPV